MLSELHAVVEIFCGSSPQINSFVGMIILSHPQASQNHGAWAVCFVQQEGLLTIGLKSGETTAIENLGHKNDSHNL